MSFKNESLAIPKAESWKMFDEISPRYDLLNHWLSFGLHLVWRKKLVNFLPDQKEQKVLDLATGTGDVLLSLFKNSRHIKEGHGIDLAEKMLAIGKNKVEQSPFAERIHLKRGDATDIPFKKNTFDTATISFGIRNVPNPSDVLYEMHRVLKPKGRGLILEFSMPENALLRTLHLFYLHTMVPLIGAMISGHYKAYQYLNQTIEQFPYGSQFCDLMTKAGFQNVKANPLLFGIATIYQGDKIL